jgi:4'-phosphopantetheinyl transferase
MPLENLHTGTNSAWALWKIEEDEPVLASQVAPLESVPDNITNPLKRLEFLAGRVLIKELVQVFGLEFHGLVKDSFGKPFLKKHGFQISLSHSYPYVAAVIHHSLSVGIDLEQPKEKLLRIAPRVLHREELLDAGQDIIKHCIYWCAKEALVKIHGKKDLVFSENLLIDPFSKEKEGQLVGRIIVNTTETTVILKYFVFEKFVVVLNQ